MKHEKIAKKVSAFTNPPIICLPLFLIISVVLSFENGAFNLSKFIVVELISLVFASILPLAIIVLWARRIKTDSDISNREDRFIPLIIGVLSYFIGFLISFILGVDNFLTLLLLCYSINTFIVMLITLKWKISVHTTGLSGPVGALILLLGPFGALFGILYPILIWSRVTLKKHTMAQAIAGGVQGFFLTVIEIYLFMDVFKIPVLNITNLTLSIFYILAIILTPVYLGVLSYTNRSKTIFIMLEALSLIFFSTFTPFSALLIFILVTLTSVLITIYADEDYMWYEIIR